MRLDLRVPLISVRRRWLLPKSWLEQVHLLQPMRRHWLVSPRLRPVRRQPMLQVLKRWLREPVWRRVPMLRQRLQLMTNGHLLHPPYRSCRRP